MVVFALAGAAVFLGCRGGAEMPVDPGSLLAAAGGKQTSGPSVTAADPAYGNQGDVAKRVTITGSGFSPGSQAAWERGGVTDPKVQVLSTEYMSSTQLVATITIADDAAIDLYDISVTALDRKKGIGYMLFEVTQAVVVEGTAILRAINSTGEMAGGEYGTPASPGGPRYFTVGSGLVVLPGTGGVWAIDEAGMTMSGFEGAGGLGGVVPIWTRSGGVWQLGTLPSDPAAAGGNGRGIASDPLTGLAIYIGGQENFNGKGNSKISKPRIWKRVPTGWERNVLPSLASDGSGIIEQISATGVAVGTSNQRAVVWEPNGIGGWTIQYLPGTIASARGVNSAGDLIVGGSGTYWQRQPGGGWVANVLPYNCQAAWEVDDLGRIVATKCQRTSRTTSAAVFLPPYTGEPIWLGGLGNQNLANVEGMSRTGGWIVGQGGGFGLYWRIF
jgi:hypothetical protein